MIAFSSDGVIHSIEQYTSIDNVAGVEFYSGILAPAMVNAHCHLELSHLKGRIEPGRGFVEFAKGISSFRGCASEQEQTKAMEFYDTKMWSEGVGAVGDISNRVSSFGVKSGSLIGYYTFIESFGLVGFDLTHSFEVKQRAEEFGLVNSIVPHSTYSLNRENFKTTVEADSGVLSIHFMESRAEAELYLGCGELSDWYDDRGLNIDFRGSVSPVKLIVDTISASRNVMLIHNTEITTADIALLKDHFGENLTFVVCPKSNKYITGCVAPYADLVSSGCRIALGTDSLSSNDTLSIIEEMKEIKGVKLDVLLNWATVGGAEALQLGVDYGKLEVGRKCGLILLEGVDLNKLELRKDSRARRIV